MEKNHTQNSDHAEKNQTQYSDYMEKNHTLNLDHMENESHFIQSHVHMVNVCLVVTCHLHFWQKDQDLLHATAITRGWNILKYVSTES